MSFGNFLSGLATTATKGAAGYEAGKAEQRDNETKMLLEQIRQARQSQQDAEQARLRDAQIGEINTRTNLLQNPLETWGDFEDWQDPQSGEMVRGQRSNRGNVRVIGAPPPKATPQYEERQENGGTAIYEDGHFKTWKIRPPTERDNSAGGRQFQQEERLRGAYQQNPVVKNAYGVANAVSQIESSATQKTPQGDLAMIYGLVKFLDPASAVREGEIDLARAARSVGTQVVGAWKKATAGRVLTDQERQNILGLLADRVGRENARVAPVQSIFGRRAAAIQGDSSYVAPSPFEGMNARTAGGTNPYKGKKP